MTGWLAGEAPPTQEAADSPILHLLVEIQPSSTCCVQTLLTQPGHSSRTQHMSCSITTRGPHHPEPASACCWVVVVGWRTGVVITWRQRQVNWDQSRSQRSETGMEPGGERLVGDPWWRLLGPGAGARGGDAGLSWSPDIRDRDSGDWGSWTPHISSITFHHHTSNTMQPPGSPEWCSQPIPRIHPNKASNVHSSHHFCQHRYQLANSNAYFHSNEQTYNAAKPHKISSSYLPTF